jgi:hypothetical protein
MGSTVGPRLITFFRYVLLVAWASYHWLSSPCITYF